MELSKPPQFIDGAQVLYWAWSGEKPFGTISDSAGELAVEIFGLAICQYKDANSVYRFSCDLNWETEQDSPYENVEQAIEFLPDQYKKVPITWQKMN